MSSAGNFLKREFTFWLFSKCTQFLSGSSFCTRDWIHLTPEGITLAVAREEGASCFAPAPTKVQSG